MDETDSLLLNNACQGISQQITRLYCVYNYSTDPFLKLAPLKMEILSLDPYVVVYHQVLLESQINYFIEKSSPKLQRAYVRHYNTTNEIVEYRTSQLAWFNQSQSNVFSQIIQKSKEMTGFNPSSYEDMQVMNYGLGGRYASHYDSFKDDVKQFWRYRLYI